VTNLERECIRISRILEQCEGSFLAEISFFAGDDDETVEIKLAQVPRLELMEIKMGSIRYLKIDKPPGIDGLFVDQAELLYLPRLPLSWPEEAEGLVRRFEELSELAWFRLVGPAEIQVIGERLTSFNLGAAESQRVDSNRVPG
jgi:hypothetical protein